jgi:hypothetical protein
VDEPARPSGPAHIHGRQTQRVSRGALSRCNKLSSGTDIEKMTQGPPGWSRGDSNPGPPPCKGGALPTKLRPQNSSQQTHPQVGAPGLEPGTSALSGPRSDHLSYAPVATPSGWSSSNTVWRPDVSGYLCPRRSARSRPIARSGLALRSLLMSPWDLVRGSVRLHSILSASARRSTRRDRLEARCPRTLPQHPTA